MSYQPYTEASMTEPNFAQLDWRLQDEALQATGSDGDRYTIEYVAADPDVGIMDPYWFVWVQEPDGEIADSWHMDTLHEALSSCQRRANMRASLTEALIPLWCQLRTEGRLADYKTEATAVVESNFQRFGVNIEAYRAMPESLPSGVVLSIPLIDGRTVTAYENGSVGISW